MAKRLEEEEKARIEQQKKALGEEGLKKMEQALEAAKKEHDKEIPTEILTSFPVPNVKSIAWIPVLSLQEVGTGPGRHRVVDQRNNENLARHIQADGSPVPFFVEYDHVEVIVQEQLLKDVYSPLPTSLTSSQSAHIYRLLTCQMTSARK
jgi:Zn-dependent M16 (insulinase) family peptidase